MTLWTSLRNRWWKLQGALRQKLRTVYQIDHTTPLLIQLIYVRLLGGSRWWFTPPTVGWLELGTETRHVFVRRGEWYCRTTFHPIT